MTSVGEWMANHQAAEAGLARMDVRLGLGDTVSLSVTPHGDR
jgi:hypothetical protein